MNAAVWVVSRLPGGNASVSSSASEIFAYNVASCDGDRLSRALDDGKAGNGAMVGIAMFPVVDESK